MKDLERVLSALATTKELLPSNIDSPRFVASVTSVSDDRSTIRIKLCTGSFLDVPTAVLKNPSYLGTAGHQNENWGLGSGEIDVSTGAGMLIQQMAHEITRLCRLLHASRKSSSHVEGTETKSLSPRTEHPSDEKKRSKLSPFDTELPPQSIKLSFDGVAGTPVTIRYTTPPTQYIGAPYVGHPTWSVDELYNCFFTKPPSVADPFGFNTWIEFFCDAAHGTPIGERYSAFLSITVDLVQRTT